MQNPVIIYELMKFGTFQMLYIPSLKHKYLPTYMYTSCMTSCNTSTYNTYVYM